MNEVLIFHPDRRLGLVFHAVVILSLVAIGAWGLFQITQAQFGPGLFLYLVPILIAIIVIPIFVYRAYALYRAAYVLAREGIQLRWGLRLEDVPMDIVEWVSPAEMSKLSLPKPRLRWPGSVTGLKTLPDGRKIEFMASTTGQLILISTPKIVYAISPRSEDEFLEAVRHFGELGSLAPIPARSVFPVLFWAQVWNTKTARYLILVGISFALALLIWVSFIIPARAQIPFGFRPDGTPADQVPAGQLLLFPIANGIFYLSSVILGLFFFRRSLNREDYSRPENNADRALAYLLWLSGVLSGIFFISAVFFILQVS